jgi:hypothetical protein
VLLILLAVTQPIYADDSKEALSRLLQQAVAQKAPKEMEMRSPGWGRTIPIPERLANRRLRTRVKVGEREEFPHGAWIRTFIRIDDPAKDITISVREIKKDATGKTAITVEATVDSHVARQHQQWVRGLRLFDITTEADMTVLVTLDCHASIGLDTKVFPPRPRVDASVASLTLDLKEFTLLRVGPLVDQETTRSAGEEIKEVVAALIKAYEEDVKVVANQAIRKALSDPKSPLRPKEGDTP